MTESRWITFDEACEELRLPRRTMCRLIRQKRLVGLVTGSYRQIREWRILDPSDRYKEALSNEEQLLSRRHQIDLMRFPVISTPEFAAVTGINASTLRNHIQSGRLKPWKVGRYSYFTVMQVREFLLYRQHREPTDRRARCAELVRWCLSQLEKNPLPSMSEEEIRRDDQLEGKLRRLMQQKEPGRSQAIAEFWRRYELASSVARTIQKTKQ